MVKRFHLKLIIMTPLLLIIIIFITGCNVFVKEDKQFSALKTEAVYSSFGYPGFARDGINVIEILKHV